MKKETILVGIIGLLVGIVVTGFVAGQSINNSDEALMGMMGADTDRFASSYMKDDDAMSMDDMNRQLEGLSGDQFDAAFLRLMIDHHIGAVNMAELAATRAKHDEIKTLSNDIVTAQKKEIAQMQVWQIDWNYLSSRDLTPGMMH